MKRIAVAGMLNNPNIGDQFLGKVVEFIIKDRFPEALIVKIDFDPKLQSMRYYSTGIVNRCISFIPKNNKIYKLQYKNMRLRLEKYYDALLKDVDALVFAVGSLKYGTQRLWMNFSILVNCCSKKGIPVMFNSVNIQKGNTNDYRYQILKAAVNNRCVKYITTRDGKNGVERLEKDYITNSELYCTDSIDPGFWIPDSYGIRKQKSDIVGINLIRPDIYDNYSFSGMITENDLIDLYEKIVRFYLDSGVQFELFTNGLKEDLKIIDRIKERNNIKDDLSKYLRVPNSPKELVEIVSKYKLVWGARLHAWICALSFDIPATCFVWDDKIKFFADFAGIYKYVLGPDELNADNAINMLCNCDETKFDWKKLHQLKMKTSDTIFDFITQFAE